VGHPTRPGARRHGTRVASLPEVDDPYLNAEILDCLAEGGAMAPADVGRRLGMSEGAAVSCLSMLAQEGKVRICLVERR
jgi:hypothetical protein